MKVLLLLTTSLVAAPVSAGLTLVLSPFWRWIEARSGLEAIGHSGPAGWCYLSLYIVVLSALVAGYLIHARLTGRTRSFDQET